MAISQRVSRLLPACLALLLWQPAAVAEEQWDQLYEEAVKHHQAGEYIGATNWAEKALSYARERLGEKHPSTLASLNILAVLYGAQGRYERAEPLYVEALALRKEVLGEKHPNTLDSLNNLASLYYSQGRYDQAEPLFVEALALRKEVLGEKHPNTLDSLNNLAVLYGAQGRYERVEPLLVEALALNKEVLGEKHSNTLNSLNNLAVLYYSQGRYDRAEPLFVETLALHKEVLGEKHPNTLIGRINLASLYRTQGRYERAEPLYVKAVALLKEVLGEKHPSTLSSLNNLAELYRAQGRYERAEPLYVEALALRKEVLGEKHPNTLDSLNNLASLYYFQGRYDRAEPLFVEAVALFKRALGEKHPDTLANLNNLAVLYGAQGRYERVEPLLVEALALNREVLGEKHPSTLTSLNNLGGVYYDQGRYERAEPLLVEALALNREVLGEKHPSTLASLNNLAKLYRAQGRYERAEPLLVEALALNREVLGEKHPSTLASLNNLAELYRAQGRHEQAEALSDVVLSASQAFLIQVLWGAGERTRQSYIGQQRGDLDLFLTLYVDRPTGANARRALALSLNNKGLLLQIATQIRAVSRSSDDPALKELAVTLKDNRQRLANLVLSGKSEPAAIQALEETINQQQAELGLHVQQLERSSLSVSPEQVIDALDEHSVLVDFLIYRPHTPKSEEEWQSVHLLALVVTTDAKHPIRIISLGELAPIQQAIREYRKVLRASLPLTGSNQAVTRRLYEMLWSPLLPALEEKQRVYVVPDGILNLLPFSALMDDSGRYLIEQYQVNMLSSGRDLVLRSLEAEVTAPVIVAAPLYDASQGKDYAVAVDNDRQGTTVARAVDELYFRPLPGALEEGEALTARFKDKRQSVSYFKLAAATEPAVAAVRSPRILHLATHGFYLEDLPTPSPEQALGPQRGLIPVADGPEVLLPATAGGGNPLLRSGLALVNANMAIKAAGDEIPGILTAEEVLNLPLAGTELVVLSACESGVGDIQTGEGVYGLRRAFQEAGAESVVSTLWAISDEGTRHFMDRFYERFLDGVPAQPALRATQLEFVASERWSHPYYWAPFVMVARR